MALRIEAIASYTGLKGIFKLLAADIYEVTSVDRIASEGAISDVTPGRRGRRAEPDAVFTMKALQDLSQRINAADCMERLLDSILAGIDEFFGFSHSMILLAGEEPGTLVTIASRGYPEGGAGAEARIGEGIIGVVAEARKPIRISGLLRGMLYANAMKKGAEASGWCPPDRRIPLPGLQNPASQLGVPLLVRGELLGVLCIESETPYRFHEEDKQSIELLGSYLAIAIQNMQLQETPDAAAEAVAKTGPAKAGRHTDGLRPAPDWRRGRSRTRRGCDDRARSGVLPQRGMHPRGRRVPDSQPARAHPLEAAVAQQGRGRDEFTNRELRLDKSLNLPGFKDNLETRLLLLRRRLEQKSADIRLVPRARGRFALELGCAVQLVEKP